MKSKLTICIIGSMLLTVLTPTSIKAQAQGDIGTNRQQQTCPSRLEPRKGAIGAAQAIKYATCEAEADRIVKSPGRTDFIDITSLQVNPKPRQADSLDIHYFGKAIANSPVYEIKGTAVAYSCAAIDNSTGRRGKNCLNTHVDDRGPNNSEGVCFKEPSGNWRCRLSIGTKAVGLQYGPPPNSTNPSGSSQTQTAPSDNNSASYYNRQAAIKWRNKDYQGALADMNRAIQIEPNNPRLYVDRSRVKLYALKDRSGAIKDWQQAANLFRQQGDTRGSEDMLWLIKKYNSGGVLPNDPN
jgi:hypothetical protein